MWKPALGKYHLISGDLLIDINCVGWLTHALNELPFIVA
jgi:hypothetical protein